LEKWAIETKIMLCMYYQSISQTEHIYTVSQKKLCQCYFVNKSVKHWPYLIIFGTQHREETWHKSP